MRLADGSTALIPQCEELRQPLGVASIVYSEIGTKWTAVEVLFARNDPSAFVGSNPVLRSRV